MLIAQVAQVAQGTVLCVDLEPSFCYTEMGDIACRDSLSVVGYV